MYTNIVSHVFSDIFMTLAWMIRSCLRVKVSPTASFPEFLPSLVLYILSFLRMWEAACFSSCIILMPTFCSSCFCHQNSFLISCTRKILLLVLIIADIFVKQLDYIMKLWERFPSVSQNLESCEFYECSRVVVQYIMDWKYCQQSQGISL